MTSTTPKKRPGPRIPLNELPLEQFLEPVHTPFKPSPSPLRPPKKRALSPSSGAPTMFTPDKRRLLDSEGVFTPSMSIKSALPTRTMNPLLDTEDIGSNSGFDAVVPRGRKLDFESLPATPSSIDTSCSPSLRRLNALTLSASSVSSSSASAATLLAPSPDIITRAPNSHTAGSSSSRSQSMSKGEALDKANLLPRHILSSPSRRSAPYPRFDVYHDPQLLQSSPAPSMDSGFGSPSLLGPAFSLAPRATLGLSLAPPAFRLDDDDREATKENVAPPRPRRSLASPRNSGGSPLLSLVHGDGRRMTHTPRTLSAILEAPIDDKARSERMEISNEDA